MRGRSGEVEIGVGVGVFPGREGGDFGGLFIRCFEFSINGLLGDVHD